LRICALMQGMGMRIHLYDRENCYVNYSDEYLKMYEEICHIQAVYVEDLYAFIENSSQKFFKLLAMVRKEERNQVRDTLRQKLGEDEFYISCSASTLVEVTSVNDTKAAAVEFLCKYYNVDKSAVLSFGDNQNDAPLLQAAGHGVAVANSDEFLKSVADEVFDKTCDEDAVGDYILRFVL
ncbi:MAG: HAD hydrolase family protein, partial [Clostridia bacterium]|nr:HAD hydrolase family protein [Clostridia bacterium]